MLHSIFWVLDRTTESSAESPTLNSILEFESHSQITWCLYITVSICMHTSLVQSYSSSDSKTALISQSPIFKPMTDITALPLPQVPGISIRADVHSSAPDMWAITIMMYYYYFIYLILLSQTKMQSKFWQITKKWKWQTIQKCRRCLSESCPSNGDILSCPEVCSVSCKRCGQVSGCRGVDNGKNCTAEFAGDSGINSF